MDWIRMYLLLNLIQQLNEKAMIPSQTVGFEMYALVALFYY